MLAAWLDTVRGGMGEHVSVLVEYGVESFQDMGDTWLRWINEFILACPWCASACLLRPPLTHGIACAALIREASQVPHLWGL